MLDCTCYFLYKIFGVNINFYYQFFIYLFCVSCIQYVKNWVTKSGFQIRMQEIVSKEIWQIKFHILSTIGIPTGFAVKC